MTPVDPLGRLLPRYELAGQRPEIAWNIKPATRKPPRPETMDQAFIIDLSLGGALIEASGDDANAVGDKVMVRFGDIEGHVIIRHRQDIDAGVLFGVEWDVSIDALDLIKTAVGLVRATGELPDQWTQSESPTPEVQSLRRGDDFLRNRLLPRHSLSEQRPRIGWDVKSANPLRRRRTPDKEAVLLDLSLGGALVEVSAPDTHSVNDVITVRLGGVDDHVTIRHRQESGDTVLYGVQWSGSYEMARVVTRAVEMTVGDTDHRLQTRWESGRD